MVSRIIENQYFPEYHRSDERFRVDFTFSCLQYAEDPFEVLSLLTDYFDEDPHLFFNELEANKNVWFKWFVQSKDYIGNLKKHSGLKKVEKLQKQYRDKWLPIEERLLDDEVFCRNEEEIFASGTFVVLSIYDNVRWGINDANRIHELEYGINFLTLLDGYRAYAIYGRTRPSCPKCRELMENLDEQTQLEFLRQECRGVLVWSQKADDRMLVDWARSYGSGLPSDNFVVSTGMLRETENLNREERTQKIRGWILEYLNKSRLEWERISEFCARRLNYHGELLEYEKVCATEYMEALVAHGDHIREEWGDRYKPGSVELAQWLLKSFRRNAAFSSALTVLNENP